MESSAVVSRFLAKVAIEALALHIQENEYLLDELFNNNQLDLLRNHARKGETINWPVSIRRIYHEDATWDADGLKNFQIVHEFDFLCTDEYEIYFVLSLFGVEYVINMGGPSLEGWERWLAETEDNSPLHHGKNATIEKMR